MDVADHSGDGNKRRLAEPVPIQFSDAGRDILEDHGKRSLGPEESARVWSHPALKGVELFQGSYRKYEFAHHFHAVPAIGVVDSGAMRCDYKGTAHHIAAGAIMMLNPGDVHAPGPVSEQGWSFRVFFLENALFQAKSNDVARQVFRFAKPFLNAPRLAKSLLTLHVALEEHRDTLDAEEALLNTFEELAQLHDVAQPELPNFAAETRLIRRCREYIDAYYRRNISLAELSAAAECSSFHLVRAFRREVGLTPHAYLIQVRVEASKRLLRSRRPIAEVASLAGFTDQGHLTRHFKRLTGVTPSRYRPCAS